MKPEADAKGWHSLASNQKATGKREKDWSDLFYFAYLIQLFRSQ